MTLYWKAIAFALTSVVLRIALSHSAQHYSILLTLAATAVLLTAVLTLLNPVLVFLRDLIRLGDLSIGFLTILLKCLGISITGEMAVYICQDSGNAALGKTVQLLTMSAILYLSLPLFSELLDLLQRILGEL